MKIRSWTEEQIKTVRAMLESNNYRWEDISSEVGKSIGAIKQIQVRHFPQMEYPFHRYGKKRTNIKLTDQQQQLILGSTLGDMYIASVSKNAARCSIKHSDKQKEFVDHKYVVLKNLVNTPPKRVTNRGWGDYLYSFTTVTNPVFRPYRNLCYKRGTKTINEEWLNKINGEGIAYWYMDDGSCSNNVISLSTHSFNKSENIKLAHWLRIEWGITVSVREDKRIGKYYLRIKGDSRFVFNELVKPFIINSMAYKILSVERSYPVSCSICGKQTDRPANIYRMVISTGRSFICDDDQCKRTRKHILYRERYANCTN